MTKLARKRDFRGGSISEFFHDIDVNRTSSLADVEEQHPPTVAAQPQDSALRAHSGEAHETDAKGKRS